MNSVEDTSVSSHDLVEYTLQSRPFALPARRCTRPIFCAILYIEAYRVLYIYRLTHNNTTLLGATHLTTANADPYDQ